MNNLRDQDYGSDNRFSFDVIEESVIEESLMQYSV